MPPEAGTERKLAEALVDEGFPMLSPEEEAVLVRVLSGFGEETDWLAAEAVSRHSSGLARILDQAREGANGSGPVADELTSKLVGIARRQRGEERMRNAWDKLRKTAEFLGQAFDMGAFELADFALASAMLGGEADEDVFSPEPVTPLAGESGDRSKFVVRVPLDSRAADFEILDQSGRQVEGRAGLAAGSTHEFLFEALHLRPGEDYEWNLILHGEDGGVEYHSGLVTRSEPGKVNLLVSLARAAASEADSFRRNMLQAIIYFHHDVFAAGLEQLKSMYDGTEEAEERQQILLMTQRTYRRLRDYLFRHGFPQQADRVMGRIAAAEKQIEGIALQPVG